MNETEYIVKVLSRTKRKDYENYVVNAIWNRLGSDRSGLKPESQKYVVDAEGQRHFIDMYFPQLNIGIEIDEWHHLKQHEEDRARSAGIYDILTQISTQHGQRPYQEIRIPIYDETSNLPLSLAEFDDEIDRCVELVRNALQAERKKGTFEPWSYRERTLNKEIATDDGYIHVGDDIDFHTIADACNTVCGTDYKGLQRSFFPPKGPFHAKHPDWYVWFPKLTPDGRPVSKGWVNVLSEDCCYIYQ